MTFKYTLYDNKLTQDIEGDHVAHPVEMKVNSYDDLEKNMTGPGSILKSTEIRAVLAGYWSEIYGFISKGENYRDEHISVKFCMSGVYTGPDDRYDQARHSVTISITPGKLLKDAAKGIAPQYTRAATNLPVIDTVYDWGSDSNDLKLTPGDILEIKGLELKIYDETAGQGVFFVNQDDGQETAADKLRTNEPSTLTLRIPQLAAGPYRIEVRNTVRNGKTIRTGVYTTPLMVNE